MARGWESKAVESQMDDAGLREGPAAVESLTPEQRQRRARLKSLTLSRTRVVEEIRTCTHERFKAQLEVELRYLDTEIAKLG